MFASRLAGGAEQRATFHNRTLVSRRAWREWVSYSSATAPDTPNHLEIAR
jgi:hypothetical protein